MILEMIRQANDIKKLNSEQLKILADEIRQFLIEKISRTGGHLASNLGVVELTMALHLTLDFPEDEFEDEETDTAEAPQEPVADAKEQ